MKLPHILVSISSYSPMLFPLRLLLMWPVQKREPTQYVTKIIQESNRGPSHSRPSTNEPLVELFSSSPSIHDLFVLISRYYQHKHCSQHFMQAMYFAEQESAQWTTRSRGAPKGGCVDYHKNTNTKREQEPPSPEAFCFMPWYLTSTDY